MANSASEEILVRTAGPVSRSGESLVSRINIDGLSKTIRVFVEQMQSVLEEIPLEVKKFQLSEFTVSAEVSADGKLVILGSGIELGSKAGIEFKFERKSDVS